MQDIFLKTIHQHQNIIHKVSRMYRDSHEDQQDLFQEIVYQLWKAYPKFRNESKVSTWMYRIALNTAIATYRKPKIPIDRSDTIPDKFHPTDRDEISENQERLFAALRLLNDSEKQSFLYISKTIRIRKSRPLQESQRTMWASELAESKKNSNSF